MARAMGRKNVKSSRFIHVNTLTVDDYDGRSMSTVDADTEDLEVYFEPVKGRIYVPAHDDQPFETIEEANNNRRHVRVKLREKADDGDWRMNEARRILDDQYSTESEKIEALMELTQVLDEEKEQAAKQVAKLQSLKSLYAKEITTRIQAGNNRTNVSEAVVRRSERQKAKTQEKPEPTQKEVQKEDSDQGEPEVSEDEVMGDYDAVFVDVQQQKKRVRFEEALLAEPVKPVAESTEINRDEAQEAQESEEESAVKVIVPREVRHAAGSKGDRRERKKTEKARSEAARRGSELEEARPKHPEEVFGMFEDTMYEQETPQGIKVWREDQYTAENAIDDVSDFTVASYLMDNRVTL